MKRISLDAVVVLAAASSAAAAAAQAQESGIQFTQGTHVSIDNPQTPHFETFLAVNPRNPRQLLAVSMIAKKGEASPFRSVAYRSTDGGQSWRRVAGAPKDTFTLSVAGDPVAYFDRQGVAFVGTYCLAGFCLIRSADGGEYWSPTILAKIGGIQDRPYLAFDTTSGPYSGHIYAVASGQFRGNHGAANRLLTVRASMDGGQSFHKEELLLMQDGKRFMWSAGDPLVTPQGQLVIPVEIADADTAQRWQVGVVVSNDGGATFERPRYGPSHAEASGWSSNRTKAFSALRAAIDPSSGPHRGRIYLLWTERIGSQWSKRIVSTDDQGLHWSAPATINDNTDGHAPGNAGIAVNRDGVVGVIWNDRRDDPADDCFRLYFAASIDGGATFGKNARASDTPVCPGHDANAVAIASVSSVNRVPGAALTIFVTTLASRWPNGGDTYGLVADANGVFHAAWINSVNDVMQLWYSQIRVDRGRLAAAQRAGQPGSSSTGTRREVTEVLDLRFEAPVIDWPSRRIDLRVRVANPSATAVHGPFTIVAETDVPGFRALNADNGRPGAGAAWQFPGSAGSALAGGGQSEAKLISWTYTGDKDAAFFVNDFRPRFRVFTTAP